mgnify:CR=1 FL=1
MTDYMLDPPEDRDADAYDDWYDNVLLEEVIEPDQAYEILCTLLTNSKQAQKELERAMDKAWEQEKKSREDNYWEGRIDQWISERDAA